jgi:hypothetical protein
MLSLIYFSLIIFTMIIKTIQLNYSRPKSCFNFNGTYNRRENICVVKEENYPTVDRDVKPQCMQCTLKYTVDFNHIQPTCSKDFECATLIFDSNFMFEKFFGRHRNKIQNMFPTRLRKLFYPYLKIIVTNYDITEITNNYIESKVNMIATDVAISITFKKHSQGLPSLTVKNQSYQIGFRSLRINVLCDDGNSSASYMVRFGTLDDDHFAIEDRCPEFQSTQLVSSYKYYHVD